MGVADRWKDWEEPRQQGGLRFVAPRLTSAVKWLIAVNVGLFVLLWIGPKFAGARADAVSGWLVAVFGLYPGDWSAPYLPVWQFLSHGFLHDPGSLSHLFWNMLLLYFFGTRLEGLLGARRFMTAYMGGMLSGALLHCVGYGFGWAENVPVLGASGAILGVVVACAVFRPNDTVMFFFIPLSLKVLVGCLVLFDLFWAVESISDVRTGTAHWVHLGGAAFGFVGARRGWLQKDLFARFEARRAIRVEERKQEDEGVVDRLLEKISQEGLGSLTEKEKAALKRASGKERL